MAKGDIISRLRLESGEFDSKIKRAGQELLAYAEHCRKMSQSMGYANQDAKDFAKALGSMQTVSQTARGKINELSEAFVNAKVMYKNMTDEEKKGEFGKNLAASLDQLKTRLNAAKQDLADVNKELAGGGKFGEFGNVLDTIGNKLGLTTNVTELLTSKTALMYSGIGAGIAVVTKATEAWAGYNAELAKQDQITTVTTGLKGDDADRMTDKMRALSDTYNVDFREAVNAANTLMTQFGKSGDEATQLIKDGMQGMIQGDGPKLLSMIQQYAPAFRDAGVSASQLVAVIHNSEGGIFTDQNMNAIVLGIKNIRLMTKATSDALAQLGIDGQKMSKQLNDGTLTIFDALKQVANQIQSVDSNSKAAGEVMQQVFGRQGAMAGTKLGEAIATLNTNLEETKKQTGEVGEAFADLQEANEKLNTAIRDCFEYDGWDQMAKGIQTNLITALAGVLEYIGKIKGSLSDFATGSGIKGSGGYSDVEKTQQWINNGKNDDERRQRYDKAIAQLQSKLNKIGQEYSVKNADGSISYKVDDAATQAKKRAALEKRMSMLYATSYTPEPPKVKPLRTGGNGNTGKTTTVPTYAEDSIAAQQALVSELTKKWNEAGASMQQGYLEQLVEAEAKLKQMKADTEWMKDLAMGKFSGQGFISMGEALESTGMPNPISTRQAPLEARWLSPETLAKANREAEKTPKKKEEKKEEKYLSEGLSQLSGGLGGLQNGFAQLGIDLGDGFGSVVNSLSGISTILMAIQTIVGAIEAISAADAIIPFAGGGIVKAAGGTLVGNSYSGDNLRAIGPGGQLYGLNAGEVVLNRSQVGNLASQLSDGGMGNLHLETYLDGRAIRIVLNNESQGRLKGKYVTSNKR